MITAFCCFDLIAFDRFFFSRGTINLHTADSKFPLSNGSFYRIDIRVGLFSSVLLYSAITSPIFRICRFYDTKGIRPNYTT